MTTQNSCMKSFNSYLFSLLFLGSFSVLAQTPSSEAEPESSNKKGVLLKNLANISGMRTNQLLGYGLVVGLSGTGDTRSSLASRTVQNLLGSLGQGALANSKNRSGNVAAVLVMAEIQPFSEPGDRVSVIVSSIGDARSLEGGVLVQTPLYAGNKVLYAVAQGPLTIGNTGIRKTYRIKKTTAQVINGAIVEKSIKSDHLNQDPTGPDKKYRIRISLKQFDFSTLDKVHKAIKAKLKDSSVIINGGSILVTLPDHTDPVSYIASLEQIRVQPDLQARIVINTRTGTVVMGGDVRVEPVAISRGGMELIVTGEMKDATMGIHTDIPGSLQKPAEISHEFKGTSIQEIVKSLNAMGASVRDIIAILEALKTAGALHAELIVN